MAKYVHMLRLWNRLVKMDLMRLTHRVFLNDWYMAQNNTRNWCYNMWRVFCAIGLEDCFYNRESCDITNIKVNLLKIQRDKWEVDVLRKPKLRFYRMFKSKVQLEDYVQSNLSPAERSYAAQFRFGILPLQVETGRFRKQTMLIVRLAGS